MVRFVDFVIIYSILIFIWSYVYANTRKGDNINKAFLLFLSVILIWMLLSVSSFYITNSMLSIIIKSLYFIALLNISIVFLNFVYRLIEKKYDFLFYFALFVNISTVFSRYLYPINYSIQNFWRLDEINITIATLMASMLTLPMIWAIILIIKHYRSTQKIKLKVQLKYVLLGIAFASVISILSEYIIPAFFHTNSQFSLMYIAILSLVSFLFFAIVKHQFLNVQIEYVYQKLFLFSNEGIILIDKDMTILSINQAAKAILKYSEFTENLGITNYIKDYDFNENYNQHETTVQIGNELCYLMISQSPIESGERITAKLLHVVDITKNKQTLKIEKENLIKQSTIDQLTGLYNKRYYLDYCMEKKSEYKDNMVIVFIDIDNFKSINDNLGHLVGDQVIKAVASIIISSLRKDEKAIRYGGDEFLIILEKTTIENAYLITERIQNKVQSVEIEESSISKLSLSIGLSEGNGDVNILTQKADTAMYYSKFHGKNQTTIYNDALIST